MKRKTQVSIALAAALSLGQLTLSAGASAQMRVASDKTVGGFAFPESVGCDAKGKALYVSEFGSKLAPAEKDGMGRISKLSLDGKVLEKQFLPAAGGGKLNKPKGIWIRGDRLWVTDIDVGKSTSRRRRAAKWRCPASVRQRSGGWATRLRQRQRAPTGKVSPISSTPRPNRE
jgi:hypothetical protein